MVGRNTNVYFQEEVYNRLRQITGGKISKFVNEAVGEKIKKAEKAKEEDLKKRLIKGYKKVAKSKKMQAEDKIWEGAVEDGIDDE